MHLDELSKGQEVLARCLAAPGQFDHEAVISFPDPTKGKENQFLVDRTSVASLGEGGNWKSKLKDISGQKSQLNQLQKSLGKLEEILDLYLLFPLTQYSLTGLEYPKVLIPAVVYELDREEGEALILPEHKAACRNPKVWISPDNLLPVDRSKLYAT